MASFDHPQSLKMTWIYASVRQRQAIPEPGRRRESGIGRMDGHRHTELPIRRSAVDQRRHRYQRLPLQREFGIARQRTFGHAAPGLFERSVRLCRRDRPGIPESGRLRAAADYGERRRAQPGELAAILQQSSRPEESVGELRLVQALCVPRTRVRGVPLRHDQRLQPGGTCGSG